MSDETPDVELLRKVLPKCSITWEQDILNYSTKILDACNNEEKIESFFNECEDNIKDTSKCHIKWNLSVHSFGGDVYNYVIIFYSEVIERVVKVALRINMIQEAIFVGGVDFASEREEKQLNKHLSTTDAN